MKVSVKDVSACRKKMEIEVPAEAIAEERAKTLKAYCKMANIPGFRKGKAPAAVVARKFASQINKDVEEQIFPKSYREALDETELKVVEIVEVSEPSIEEDQPLSFEVTVDVEPEFDLPKYEQIPVKEEKVEVTDEMVQEQIDAFRQQHRTYEDAEKTIEKGDMGELEYEATVDGKPLEELIPKGKGLGKGSGYWVSADEYAFIPGMGEAIIGLNAGDEKSVTIEFPEDFAIEELRGVKADYQVKVTAVRTPVLPELDEEFLKRFGAESEDDFRAQIREHLQKELENRMLDAKYGQIVDYLIKKTKLEVPETILKRQTRNVMYDIARQRVAMGMTQEQVAEQQEEILKEAEKQAEESVKLRYIGLAIAAEKEFEADEVDVDDQIAAMAVERRTDARSLRREMEKEGTISSIYEQVRFNKAFDYMLENAKIK